jgi:hypothetical protein
MLEIPARELYCRVTISGLSQSIVKNDKSKNVRILYLISITAHVLLMFIIRTVRLLESSCCLSHLVCQLTLINILL